MVERTYGLDKFEDVQRLIVVAAHPDDLESLCGGTVALLTGRGVKVSSVNCTLGDIGAQDPNLARPALDAYMPSKMPLYRPEQLNEPAAKLGRIERAFLFSTDRQPDVFVDVSAVYETKIAACVAHRSQFPKGEESLEWMREIDRRQAAAIEETTGVAYAESFKQIRVW